MSVSRPDPCLLSLWTCFIIGPLKPLFKNTLWRCVIKNIISFQTTKPPYPALPISVWCPSRLIGMRRCTVALGHLSRRHWLQLTGLLVLEDNMRQVLQVLTGVWRYAGGCLLPLSYLPGGYTFLIKSWLRRQECNTSMLKKIKILTWYPIWNTGLGLSHLSHYDCDIGCRAPATVMWLRDDKFKKEDKRRNVVIR